MTEIYEPAEDSYLLANVLKRYFSNNDKNLDFLEVGCGSGILIKTLLEIGVAKEKIQCVDINSEAITQCKNLGINCFESNLFDKINKKFDVIIFNPPYLPEDKNEPQNSRLATTGGKKGSEVINKFLFDAKKHLREEGIIFLLTSSLTKEIDFLDYEMTLLASKKLFFEELFVWGLKLLRN